MALSRDPHLLIADEPTSALVRQGQKQIVAPLCDPPKAHGLSCLCVSHDLAVMHATADRAMMMRSAKPVERGLTKERLLRPTSAYTQQPIRAAVL